MKWTTPDAKAILWTVVPTDTTNILWSKYFSEKILHRNIIDTVVSPGYCHSLALFDGSVSFQCIAVAVHDSFGWSWSQQVVVRRDTDIILMPLGSRVLQPLSSTDCQVCCWCWDRLVF